ncbi:MAG: oligosaccharide flippase family protein [Clostridiales bacterium]|jgi:stage V sporulation protein B|nr:oligosaccharide flippase family protein [Clostridiales bacterium]
MRKHLVYNTILLTAVSIYMRSVSLVFQVYVSNAIGASGIGLFTLILSVQALAVTLATSGIRYAVTRLVAEELGLNRHGGVGVVMKRSFAYAAIFSMLAMALLYFGANRIGSDWVGDERTVLSLKILAFGLPFLSLCSVMSGYFTAVQKLSKYAAVQVFEQLCMIGCIIVLIPKIPEGRIDLSCAALVLGAAVADAAAFLFSLVLYLLDRRRYKRAFKKLAGVTGRLLRMASPLALTAYARVSLSTLQHLLVPSGLKRSGISADAALSSYGVIQGMVFPMLFFPSAFFLSVSELMIPELTEAQVSGNKPKMDMIVNRILRICISFSIASAGLLFMFGDELGSALYSTADAGKYIKILAPLVVVMYLDTVTDGMLKGLGQQLYSMGINIMDAFISVVLVYFLLPVWAIKAYLFIIFITEAFNFMLSILRLARVVAVTIKLSDFVKPLIFILTSANLSILLLRLIGLPLSGNVLSASLHIALSALFYLSFSRLLCPASAGFNPVIR